MDGEFHPFGRHEDGPDLFLGQMTDDVEGLEFAAELLQLKNGNGEEQPAVVPAVEGSRDGIDVESLAELEGIPLEGDLVGVDLDPEAGISRKTLDGIGQAMAYPIA